MTAPHGRGKAYIVRHTERQNRTISIRLSEKEKP